MIEYITNHQHFDLIIFPTLCVIFEGLLLLIIAPRLLKILRSKFKTHFQSETNEKLKPIIKMFVFLSVLILSKWHFRILAQETKALDLCFKLSITVTAILVVHSIVKICFQILFEKYKIEAGNNLRQRKIKTQLLFFQSVAITSVYILGFISILFHFEGWYTVAKSLLASAGVAGLVIGFSAQKMIGNLIAGFQIAMTQPIRVDDVLIVEGEWGWVEEITLTYVVVKIWDMRRMVLPISYFTEKPFQNWTRTNAEILGTVFLFVDYSVQVDDLRSQLTKILKEEKDWNGKVNVVQVVETQINAMQIRILVSADSSPQAFDLRCSIREKMIQYLQCKPNVFPKYRIENPKDTLISRDSVC